MLGGFETTCIYWIIGFCSKNYMRIDSKLILKKSDISVIDIILLTRPTAFGRSI